MLGLAIFGVYAAVGLVLAIAAIGAANHGAEKVVGPRSVVIIALFWPAAVFVAFVSGLIVTFEGEGD